MASPELKVRISADLKNFESNMKKVSSRLSQVGSDFKSVGRTLSTRFTVPLAAAGIGAIKLASDLEESLNKIDVTFGDSAQAVKDFADTSINAFGVSKNEALDAAALFGDMATNMGINTQEAANMSTALVGLGGDLASFKNVRIDVAQNALKSIFTGETETLKNLGIVMTQANLDAFALASGLGKTSSEMSQQEKVMLRYQFVMDKTGTAQGDFERTNTGFANSFRTLQGRIQEVSAEFGQQLLPVATEVVNKLDDMTTKLDNMSPAMKTFVTRVGGLGAVTGPVVLVLGALIGAGSRLAGVAAKVSSALSFLVKNPLRALVKTGNLARGSFLGLTTLLGAKMIGILNDAAKATFEFQQSIERAFADPASFGADEMAKLITETVNRIEEARKQGHELRVNELTAILNSLIAIRDANAFNEVAANVKEAKSDVADLNTEVSELPSKPIVLIEPIDDSSAQTLKEFNEQLAMMQVGAPPSMEAFAEFLNIDWNATFGEPLEVELTNLQQAFLEFGQVINNAFSQAIVQGKAFGDVLKSLLKQLASKALAKFLGFALTGGAGGLLGGIAGGFFGKGGGLFGKIFGVGMAEGGIVPRGFPNDTYPALLTSGEMVVPRPQALPAMGGAVEVFGEFRVRGSDLVTAISNTNSRTLR
jgi:hypothetical protein